MTERLAMSLLKIIRVSHGKIEYHKSLLYADPLYNCASYCADEWITVIIGGRGYLLHWPKSYFKNIGRMGDADNKAKSVSTIESETLKRTDIGNW